MFLISLICLTHLYFPMNHLKKYPTTFANTDDFINLYNLIDSTSFSHEFHFHDFHDLIAI